jgi:trehalose utilization protein
VQRIKAGQLSAIFLHSAHWSEPFISAMCERATEDAVKSIPPAARNKVKVKKLPPDLSGLAPRKGPLTPSFRRFRDTNGVNTLEIKMPSCVFPAVRNDGKPSHIKTLLPNHPIAKGIPDAFDIPQTEMYDEPFHVPTPDFVIFKERWDSGENFRSGILWNVGKGMVFYFRPGHETYPIFKQDVPLKIIENAVRFLGSDQPE